MTNSTETNTMKRLLPSLVLLFVLVQCDTKEKESLVQKSWQGREVSTQVLDSLEFGKSYLSVYSQVYSFSEERIHSLTSLISFRNTSEKDTMYLLRAEYYDEKGKSVKDYVEQPVFLAPLETLEILLTEDDLSSGSGNNFIIDWKIPKNSPEPLFEAVMNSTLGQQGLSFTTQAKRIE